MYKVLDIPLGVDLAEFADFLWRNKIAHRIVQTNNSQQLWLHGVDPRAGQVESIYQLWLSGTDISVIVLEPAAISAKPNTAPALFVSKFPVTITIIVICILLAIWTELGNNIQKLHWFTFTDIIQQGTGLYTSGFDGVITSGQWWRLITPTLLHFSAPHLVFNLCWMWIVAGRIEQLQGAKRFLLLFVVTGLLANTSQYFVSGPLFGGISGVVFGVIGYTWHWDYKNPDKLFSFPPALMYLAIAAIVVGYSGFFSAVGVGAIANTAHLVGLLSGILMSYLLRYFKFS